ncbi:RNA polymerase subunit AC19 [Rhizophlyctis rosea]|nr:RNA polymerase subunit AC19 [Rhizophlyctis rosea]
MSMIEPTADTTGLPQTEGEKIEILASDHDDDTVATFSIRDEDHTLGNSLRYMIMKNPAVSFCGYALPHPSEYKINLRIQTDGTITAIQALNTGLDDLMALCDVVSEKFTEQVQAQNYEVRDGAEPWNDK